MSYYLLAISPKLGYQFGDICENQVLQTSKLVQVIVMCNDVYTVSTPIISVYYVYYV